jgi:hypothetical protein
MPRLSLLLANRQAEVKQWRNGQPTLGAPASEVLLEARLSREGPFEYCRIRSAASAPLASEELKLVWSFPMAYNESMTLDASALQGIRCTCRMVRFPQPIFCKGWETLFYNRERNLAVGRTLRGAASASTRWAARHRTRPRTQLSAIRRCRKRPPLSATEWIGVGIPDRGRRMTAAAELSRSQHIGKR